MTLREKCPNTEYFLVRIFLYSVRIQENMDQKKLRIWILFVQCDDAFHFILKIFSFVRYSNFCSDFLVTWENGLTGKLRLISKFLTEQPSKEAITIHILHNVSKVKAIRQ